MKTKDIIQLDCRKQENREIIQKVLRQIKPLAKCSEEQIPLVKVEKCLGILCDRYKINIQGIYPDIAVTDNKQIVWRCVAVNQNTFETIGTTYGCTLYECICKMTILLYSKTRSKKHE